MLAAGTCGQLCQSVALSAEQHKPKPRPVCAQKALLLNSKHSQPSKQMIGSHGGNPRWEKEQKGGDWFEGTEEEELID